MWVWFHDILHILVSFVNYIVRKGENEISPQDLIRGVYLSSACTFSLPPFHALLRESETRVVEI